MVDRDKLYQLLKSQAHGVISTNNPNEAPESAFVGFAQTNRSETGDFKLIIGTDAGSRKIQNLKNDPRVSFVIASDIDKVTVQVEGGAEVLSASELGDYRQLLIKKLPFMEKIIDNPNRAYIVVSPTWIRYTDISVSPWKIEEEKI